MLEGTLTSISDDRVVVRNHELRPGPGLKIERDRGRTGLKGVAIGAAVGTVLGLAADHGNSWGAIELFPGTFWGGIFGVVMDRYVPVYDATVFTLVTPQLAVRPPSVSASAPIFDGLRASAGDRVFVTQDGIRIAGTIDSLSPSRLVVGSHEFAAGTALKIEKDGDPVWDGAATGFFAGVLLAACTGCNDGQHVNLLVAGLTWAGIGALIDWAHKGKTTIYDSTTKSSTTSGADRSADRLASQRRGVGAGSVTANECTRRPKQSVRRAKNASVGENSSLGAQKSTLVGERSSLIGP